MSVGGAGRDLLRRGFAQVPPGARLAVLHGLGRYAPWEDGFDFTPPLPGPGEVVGPPEFVGVGVQKAGTTWWYDLVCAHPAIARRPDIHKERHFFDRFATRPFGPSDIDDYHKWFPRPAGKLAGEWTPDYFTLPWVPPLLAASAPEARLILLLRDPVERFRSGLAHQRRLGVRTDGATLADALGRGFYDRALARWREHFDPTRILILQYERCAADPAGQLAATFRFLDLPDHAIPEATGGLGAVGPGRESDELTARLVDVYQADVAALAARGAEVDLSVWPNFAHLAR